MYLHNHPGSKNGHERKVGGSHLIPISPIGQRIFNDQRNPPMEPNLWLAIMNAFGFQAVVLAVVFNWDTWKADLLFFVSFVFVCLRVYFYFRKQNQAIRREELEQQEIRRHMDDKNSP